QVVESLRAPGANPLGHVVPLRVSRPQIRTLRSRIRSQERAPVLRCHGSCTEQKSDGLYFDNTVAQASFAHTRPDGYLETGLPPWGIALRPDCLIGGRVGGDG